LYQARADLSAFKCRKIPDVVVRVSAVGEARVQGEYAALEDLNWVVTFIWMIVLCDNVQILLWFAFRKMLPCLF
jgi:hypothetical protein